METYQIVCFVISMTVFAAYFLWVWWRFGIQTSISNTFYVIEKKSRNPNNKYLITLALWGFSLPIAIVGVEIHPLFWLAAALIMFVGAAPAFKYKNPHKSSKMQHNVHMVGAIGGITVAMITFFIVGAFFTAITGAVIIGAIHFLKVKNATWWVETVAFLVTWAGLLVLSL